MKYILIPLFLLAFLFVTRNCWGQSKPKQQKRAHVYYWPKVDTVKIYPTYTQIFWHKKGTYFSVKLTKKEKYIIDTAEVVNQY